MFDPSQEQEGGKKGKNPVPRIHRGGEKRKSDVGQSLCWPPKARKRDKRVARGPTGVPNKRRVNGV